MPRASRVVDGCPPRHNHTMRQCSGVRPAVLLVEMAAWRAVCSQVEGAVLNHRSKNTLLLTMTGDRILTRSSLLIDYAQDSPQLMQQSPQFPLPPHSAPSQTPFVNDFNTPYSHPHIQKPKLPRGSSDTIFQTTTSTPKPFVQTIPRNNSDIIQQPKPMPVGQFQGPGRGRVQWNLGSEG
jgi:hypothetical protein